MSFADKKLSEIAISIPGSTALLREYDLDFCCGGADTLGAAVAEKNLNLAEIEARLTELQESKQQDDEQRWLTAPYAEIIDHIIHRYHERHRAQLQELIVLAERVESVHGDRDDCPVGVAAELHNVYTDLSSHMMKEEQILFPMIKMGNYAMARMPIQVMEHEHAEHGEHLEVLKALTNNLTSPADACNTWRALYSGIKEFMDDLMMHIHTENNILFPRVIEEGSR